MSNTTKGPFMQAMEKYTKSIKTFISAQGFGHYSKPSNGIPKTDLEQSVQTSLGLADSAVQPSAMQTALSNKQDTISDLAAIRSGASAGASAVQPATMSEALALKQNSLSETQLAAVNSGINNTKVGQIETNKTNISYSLNMGVKNQLKLTGDVWNPNVLYVYWDYTNGTVRVVGSSATTSTVFIYLGSWTAPEDNVYRLYANGLACTANIRIYDDVSWTTYAATSGESNEATWTKGTTRPIYLRIASGVVVGDITVTPMICQKSVFDADPSFALHAAPNSDLTRLEAEDRASLAEVVDSGAKNVFEFRSLDDLKALNTSGTWNNNAYTVSGVTFTVDTTNKTITTSGTSTAMISFVIDAYSTATTKYAGYVLSGCPAGGNYDTGYYMYTTDTSSNTKDKDIGEGCIIGSSAISRIRIGCRSGVNMGSKTFKPMICTLADWKVSQKFVPFGNDPFYQIPINHNMIYRGRNLGATLTDAQHTALSSGNFTDLYLGDYWTKSVTIPDFYELTTAQPSDWTTDYTSYYTKSGNTYTAVTGSSAPTWAADTYYQKSVPAQTVTLKAVIADFDTFYGGYNSSYATINTHHAAVIVTGFNNVVWNETDTTAGGYVNSLIHKWLVGSVLPEMETWFGSAKVISHQKLLTNAITGNAASGWAWSSQKIALLSENQMYGSKVWGGSKATNGGYEPGEAHKHLNVFNHIAPNMLFGNKNIWLRDIASAVWAAGLRDRGYAYSDGASASWLAPAALILLS